MTLTKKVLIDQITVTDNGIILVREATLIMEDDVEISKQYHRTSFTPASDVSAQPKNVQDICAIAWTPEIITAYEAQIEANKNGALV